MDSRYLSIEKWKDGGVHAPFGLSVVKILSDRKI